MIRGMISRALGLAVVLAAGGLLLGVAHEVPAQDVAGRAPGANHPLEVSVWYRADPWAKVNQAKIESWATDLTTKVTADPTYQMRWVVTALALNHAARISPKNAEAWRKAVEPKDYAEIVAKSPAGVFSPTSFETDAITQANYKLPFPLLWQEHKAAGIQFAQSLGGGADLQLALKDDREPFGSPGRTADFRRERLTMTLVALTLGVDPYKENQGPKYNDWSGPDPGVAGTVLMGMQSAMNLEILKAAHEMDLKKAPFPTIEPKAGGGKLELTGEVFLRRWVDALIHAMLVYSCQKSGNVYDPFSNDTPLFKRVEVDKGKLDQLPGAWGVGYRNFPTEAGLVPQLHLVKRDVPTAGSTFQRSYKYSADQNILYQTASGGYTLLLAAQLLRRTLADLSEAKVHQVEGQYPLEWKSDKEWELHQGPGIKSPLVARISLEASPRYSGVILVGPGIKGRLAIDDVVEEALNFVALGLYPTDQELVANLGGAHGSYILFAIGKFLVATRHPQVIGKYAWHWDFCQQLSASPKNIETYYDLDFALLTALQAYQPAYPSAAH